MHSCFGSTRRTFDPSIPDHCSVCAARPAMINSMSYADRREYMRKYQREWVAKRRAAFFDDKTCEKCGSIDRLELDHIDPSTKVHHAIWSWAEERRIDEIAKCQILCHDCHLNKTADDYRKNVKHGTYAMRNKYGCDCEECKEYVRRNKRESRARIKERNSRL